MVDIKKFTDKDLYGLLDVDIGAAEADVSSAPKKSLL